MAQTGYTPLLIYASGTASNVPSAANLTSSASGAELALNYADGKLYFKNSSGVVTLLASAAGASGDVVGPASATDNALARFDTTTGKLIQNSVGILSDAGALSGLTDITASGNVTLSGGTANGVAYLNGSKVLTTGSALTFDGTNLGVGTSSPSSFSGYTTVSVNNATNGGIYNILVNGTETARLQAYSGIFNVAAKGAATNLTFETNGAERMRLDSSGNLGLGVTPSAWGSSLRALQIGYVYGGALSTNPAGNTTTHLTHNAWFDGTNWKYGASSIGATRYTMDGPNAGSTHSWSIAAGGTAGNTITFTQAMTLDASGKFMLGTTSTSYNAILYGSSSSIWQIANSTTGTGASNGLTIGLNSSGNGVFIHQQAYPLLFGTSGTERARIDSSGNLLVGTTTSTARLTTASAGAEGAVEVSFLSGGCQFFVNSVGGGNAAATVQRIGRNSGTTRSINAGGTINASGADYAEYMTKAGDFTVAKGDVVGIDAQGKLTNVFSNAVSFCVKSTDPSYVGGDTWGTDFENDPDGLEAARQTVDRIAFAGQVPVNVIGATAGQYIIPVNDNGAIKGDAVSSPTFEQYQQAVGKVIAIETDGRARIIVKVA